MTLPENNPRATVLMMVAGAKGAIGTTIAAALAELRHNSAAILSGLITTDLFPRLGEITGMQMVGWDDTADSMTERTQRHGVLPEMLWKPHFEEISNLDIRPAPSEKTTLWHQVEQIRRDMGDFLAGRPDAQPVLINLLPAAWDTGQTHRMETVDAMLDTTGPVMPDLGYVLAAILSGIPVVNFSPNTVELPLICREAELRGLPLAGRDGKTGQTYFKVVLASAFKARSLVVDGWYSLNILGNADGRNLMDPDRACGKLHNKTQLLDGILGYKVGEGYDAASHIVRIDYYPPRGDAKEAWDVIDFKGIFGMPMSLRLNLQGRDSILAAPMAIDLARWAAAAGKARIGGPLGELGFFFKKPVGTNPPLTFEDQLAALDRLEKKIEENWGRD